MTQEELKNIWILTTHNMPVFNYNDQRFDYYVNILGKSDRLNMIRQTLKDANYNDLLNERNDVINYFDTKFNQIDLEKKLLSVKLTYPLSFSDKNEYVGGTKYAQIDLKDAAINVLSHFNIADYTSWEQFIGEATDNPFLINNDETLRMRSVYGEHYIPNVVFEYIPYDLCYKQMLYECYSNGLNEFMEEHGCVYSKIFRDSLRFTVIDEDKFSTFEEDWGQEEYKSFGDIKTHCYISTDYYERFYLPEYDKIKKVTHTINKNNEHFVSRKSDEHYPQFKKLLLGLEVTDDDLYYANNEKKSARVQLL